MSLVRGNDNNALMLEPSSSSSSSSIQSESNRDTHIKFWKHNLEQLTKTSLTPSFNEQLPEGPQYKSFSFQVNIETELKKNIPVSNEALLLTALHVLLYRYTSELDTCIGIATQTQADFLPFRIKIMDRQTSFLTLAGHIDKRLTRTRNHALPLETIQQEALPANITLPIFSIGFKHLNGSLQPSSAALVPENIVLVCHEEANGTIQVKLEYNSHLFNTQYITQFSYHFTNLLKGIQRSPNTLFTHFPMLTSDEINQLKTWNPPFLAKADDFKGFIHDILIEQAKKTPDDIAVVFHNAEGDKEILTYGELNQQSTELAQCLTAMGAEPEFPIGISIPRSTQLIVAMMAVYKSGAVAVPFETEKSSSLEHKIKTTKLNIILVNKETKNIFTSTNFPHDKINPINIDNLKKTAKTIQSLGTQLKPQTKLEHDNLAYVCFSSGTTGVPKGVEIFHSGVINLANALKDRNLPNKSKVLSIALPTFDAFTFELLEALVTGGELHLPFSRVSSPDTLIKIINENQISLMTVTPVVLAQLDPTKLPSLKDVIVMGAVPDEQILKTWINKGITIRNEYGPTENTICTTEHHCKLNEPYTTIGNSIRGVHMHIVDQFLNETPPDVPGQILITGNQLARGYTSNTLLTQTKFPILRHQEHIRTFSLFKPIPNINSSIPLAEESKKNEKRKTHNEDQSAAARATSPQTRAAKKTRTNTSALTPRSSPTISDSFENTSSSPVNRSHTPPIISGYLSGDIGVRLRNGMINFLGRKDNQIKLFGVLIELEGITATLTKHKDIKEAIVIRQPNQESLIAYIVPHADKTITRRSLNDYIATTTLPSAVTFDHVICLQSLPVNNNGKVDTKALPAPTIASNNLEPLDPLEKTLKEIWIKILGHSDFTTKDVFSHVGGSSIHQARLSNTINTHSELRLKDDQHISLLTLPALTIENIASALRPLLATKQKSPPGSPLKNKCDLFAAKPFAPLPSINCASSANTPGHT